MNLEDIQPWVIDLLKAHPALAGVPVLADDGTYPQTPAREDALRTKGLVLIVWQIESEGLIDDSPGGAAVEEITIAIVIEENALVSRAPGGAGIRAEKVLRLVREATIGKRHASAPKVALRAGDPPFKNFGTKDGVQRIVVMLRVTLNIFTI